MKHLMVIHPECVGTVMFPDDCKIGHKTMQSYVGGTIETVTTFRAGYILVVNEENKISGELKFNTRATRILSPNIEDMIFGNALLVKVVGEDLVMLDHDEATEWMEILR